ncbi:MAG: tRNA (guanosine(46)-N7)-methyltransferase TrmB [Tepidisphaeraceae bacterium]|jgi:tRNA (guanine-N7-)-methyltransferase
MQASRDLIVEPIGLDVETLPHPIHWLDIFGNTNPVEIEIGMGKGTFLTEQAKSRLDVNFLGLEYARWFWRYSSDRLRRNHCVNVRTARAEAGYFFKEFVTDESVAAVHIYFPDPWPKKRHHKRRLIQPPFLLQIHRVLVGGGRLQIVTDHAEYFEQIQSVVNSSPLTPMNYSPPPSALEGEMVGTNFERKYRDEGRPFFAIAAMKAR